MNIPELHGAPGAHERSQLEGLISVSEFREGLPTAYTGVSNLISVELVLLHIIYSRVSFCTANDSSAESFTAGDSSADESSLPSKPSRKKRRKLQEEEVFGECSETPKKSDSDDSGFKESCGEVTHDKFE